MFFILITFLFSLNIYPGNLELGMGDAFIFKGDCASARKSYEKHLKEKYDPLIASNLAISYFCMNDFVTAETILSEAWSRLTPKQDIYKDSVRFNLGLVLSLNLKFEESLKVLSGIDENKLDNKRLSCLYATRCWDYFSTNRYTLADDICIKASKISSDSCYVLYRVGRYFLSKELPDSAYTYFNPLFGKCPDEDVAYYYALTLYKMKDKQNAEKVLLKYHKTNRNNDLYSMIKRELAE